MKINYVKKSTLNWPDIWNYLGMSRDNGGRWQPTNSTPEIVSDYLKYFRFPSRAYPNSYATALLTQKFARYLTEKMPDMAVKIGIAEKDA